MKNFRRRQGVAVERVSVFWSSIGKADLEVRMKFRILVLGVLSMITAACSDDIGAPISAPVVAEEKPDPTIIIVEVPVKINCEEIDPSFYQKGDTCWSVCNDCFTHDGICLDNDQNGYGETCVGRCELCGEQEVCLDTNSNGFGDTCVQGTEICDNNIDENGNGETDEGCEPKIVYCMDTDFDGYADCSNACVKGTKQVCGDCNDKNPDVHPNMDDYCDGFDTDCDGITDGYNGKPDEFCAAQGQCMLYFADKIGKACSGNHGACAVNGVLECSLIGEFVCSVDVKGSQSKAGPELCGDNFDNDCDGETDEDCNCQDVKKSFTNETDLYAIWCNSCSAECKTLPNIDITEDSYKLVLVWGGQANSNSPYKNELKYQVFQQKEADYGYLTSDLSGDWDAWDGVAFDPGTFVAIDLDPTAKYIRFNEFQHPGTWEICNAAVVGETYVDFSKLNLPTVYVVKNGEWEDVTQKIGMQVALDTMGGGKMPKSTSPSGYPVPNYCSATLAL